MLIAAINTGTALVLWIDDMRPFWHPLLTVQLYGFAIASTSSIRKCSGTSIASIVNLHQIARVERDWRDQPVITLKSRPEKLTVSRTFAHRFNAM